MHLMASRILPEAVAISNILITCSARRSTPLGIKYGLIAPTASIRL